MGQLKKSRRGVPQNLSELRARAEGQERSGAAQGDGPGDASTGGTVNAFSLLGAARAPGRGHDREPTAAGPGAAGTHDVPERPEQPREREGERPTERSPAPGGRDRTPRPRATGDALPLEGQTFFPSPGTKLVAHRLRPGAIRAERSLLWRDVRAQRRQRQGERQEKGQRLWQEARARRRRPEPSFASPTERDEKPGVSCRLQAGASL